jgi:hypothetical protein
MLNTYATEPMTLDVARAVSPYGDHDGVWRLDIPAAIAEAVTLTRDGLVPMVLLGIARLEDLRDIDLVESVATIDDELVALKEFVSLTPAAIAELARDLAESEAKLGAMEDALADEYDRLDEARQDDCGEL